MRKEAKISECGKYRFSLTRIWEEGKPLVMFIMLNPSTADAENDDPTIRRCIGFAKSWGYGGLIVCNLFAYRSTNPKDLLKIQFLKNHENILTIELLSRDVEKMICAWGNEPILKKIGRQQNPVEYVYRDPTKLYFLEMSQKGVPKHPLYLKKDLQPLKLL